MALTLILALTLALQQPDTGAPGPPSDTVGGACNHSLVGQGAPGPRDGLALDWSATFAEAKLSIESEDFLLLPSGWAVRAAEPEFGKPFTLQWFVCTTDFSQPYSKLKPTRETALPLPSASLGTLRSAGPIGDGLFGVCGTAKTGGGGAIVVFGFERPEADSELISDECPAEAPVVLRTRHLGGDYAGEVPIAIAPLHGVPGHAVVLTEPGHWLLDVDLSEGAPEPTRQLLPEPLSESWARFASGGKVKFGTLLHRRYGVKYTLDWDVDLSPFACFDDGHRSLSFVDRSYSGQLEEGEWQAPYADYARLDGSRQATRKALFADIFEARGLPKDGRIESAHPDRKEHLGGKLSGSGSPLRGTARSLTQPSRFIENVDLLRTADGAYAEVKVQRGVTPPASLTLHWKRKDGPWRAGFSQDLSKHDVQRFEVEGWITASGVVGPGLLLVATLDPKTDINKLQLFRIQAPTIVEAHVTHEHPRKVEFHEPERIRTVHASHLFTREGVVAIVENKNKPMSAFVLMRYASALCEVDLTKSFGPLHVVLTEEQQPALGAIYNEVRTSRIEVLGVQYTFAKQSAAEVWCSNGSLHNLALFDVNEDGQLDGRGFGSGEEEAFGEFLDAAKAKDPDGKLALLEYAGQPLGE